MLIPIIRTDNRYDYVKGFILDSLIEAKSIVKFKRITEWVTIGSDPIRGGKRAGLYFGANRRAPDGSVSLGLL